MAADRPIMDLIGPLSGTTGPLHPAIGRHWYWCREHQRAEYVGWAMIGCIRIGPFMSEREANRLAGLEAGTTKGPAVLVNPLGVEVEQ